MLLKGAVKSSICLFLLSLSKAEIQSSIFWRVELIAYFEGAELQFFSHSDRRSCKIASSYTYMKL